MSKPERRNRGHKTRPEKPLQESEPRAWQRMLSGRRLDLINPSPLDIEIEDIAHGLARVARWNGQTIGDHAFSVAQHSLVVEDIFTALAGDKLTHDASANWQLAALLHDAPEYVIGDMISPFKTVLGSQYRQFEDGLQRAIHLRFSLPSAVPEPVAKAIKTADRCSAYFEAIGLAGFERPEAVKLFSAPTILSKLPPELIAQLETLRPLPAPDAQSAFLVRFAELNAAAR